MEQQTISITKAGIQATLVARTAILAGANPAGGRYDKSKPLRYNVALPPAILSRFDLLHVMADERDDEADAALAAHIVAVHRAAAPVGLDPADAAALPPRPPPPPGLAAPYSTDQLQRYVRLARAHKPRLTPAAAAAIVAAYKRLRSDDAAPGSATAYRITVRQLEALIRLSEALARVRLADEVVPGDVREAVRLVRHSVVTVEAPDEDLAAYAEDGEGGGDGERGEWGVPPPPPGEGGGDGEEGAGGGPPAADADGDAAMADADAPPADQAQQPPAANPPAPLRVPAAKVERVKDLLLMRLRSLEAAGEAREGGGPSAARVGGVPVAAQSQRALLEWYFDFLASRGELAGVEDPAAEAGTVAAIVSYLVRARDVFVVVEQPGRRAGEGDAAYRRRATAERLLAINPNFADE
jgi:DNA replication licensing factor MCM6